MTLEEIQSKIKTYSIINNRLTDAYREMEKEIGDLKKRHTPKIVKEASSLKQLRESIVGMIDEARELFGKPRTQTLYGISFGLRKSKGRMEASEKTIELIKKHFPEKVDELIRVKEEPVKDALSNMSANDLKKIGVKVIADTDEPLIKSDYDKIEKFINSLIEDTKEAS